MKMIIEIARGKIIFSTAIALGDMVQEEKSNLSKRGRVTALE